jgi:hypothetical protein
LLSVSKCVLVLDTLCNLCVSIEDYVIYSIVLYCSVYYNVWVYLCVHWAHDILGHHTGVVYDKQIELGIHRVAFPFTSNNTTNTHYVHILHRKIILWKSLFYWCLWAWCLQICCNLTLQISKGSSSWMENTINFGFWWCSWPTSSTNGIVYIFYIIYILSVLSVMCTNICVRVMYCMYI